MQSGVDTDHEARLTALTEIPQLCSAGSRDRGYA